MSGNLFKRYIWLVDTIRRHGRISRRELERAWLDSSISEGRPLPRRTFAKYREAAEQLFHVEIKCDPSTYEYYIEDFENGINAVGEWLLNSAATNDVLTNSADIADRIYVEDVPSAREFLAPAIEAIRRSRQISFDYEPYRRGSLTHGVILEPYFLKIYRQRWYVTGLNVADRRVKTYALDRMTALRILPQTYTVPDSFDAEDLFRNSFGVIFTDGPVEDIELKVAPRRARYLRTLPLHPSQEEFVHDTYSIIRYRLRITPDFVSELLSYGPDVTVLRPSALRATVVDALSRTLAAYQS